IPLPPLAEQKRIVAKIEGLFSELDAGEESLRRARRQLGVYRQSLLKQAFEGKLTAPWRAQHPDLLESPDQLLASIQAELEARYEKQLKEWEKAGKGHGKPKPPTTVEPILAKRLAQLPELPEGWIWQTIENLVDHGRSCAYGVLQPGPHVETGVPLVRVGDIQNGRVSTVEMKRISPKIAGQYRRTELRGGEFLISLVGAIGRTAVAQHELRGANTARAVGVVPLSEAINPHFVEVCFRSPAKLAEMVSQANEVARKTLNLEDVRKATVPLCSLPEQQEIVRLLDAQFEVIEQNEREIDAALKRSEALRQSILKKAFTGQLVPQDPTDEPASELLARIRGEREDADAIQPKATKKATAR
ncbi:MAG: restriction endonuclease subunit S, partial [Verrucomicrobiae bacterium]|nr:restriction endonuclease subunit S [Verrucomicrobiae bacterium]